MDEAPPVHPEMMKLNNYSDFLCEFSYKIALQINKVREQAWEIKT